MRRDLHITTWIKYKGKAGGSTRVSARQTMGGLDKKSGTSRGSKGKGSSRVIVMSLRMGFTSPNVVHVDGPRRTLPFHTDPCRTPAPSPPGQSHSRPSTDQAFGVGDETWPLL